MPAHTPGDTDLQIAAAVNAGDVDAALAFYELDASFAPGPGQVVTGIDAIREVMNGFVAMKPSLNITVERVVQAGDIALLHSNWTLKGTGPDGSAVDMAGRGVEVVRRQSDGTWRFIIDNPWGAG